MLKIKHSLIVYMFLFSMLFLSTVAWAGKPARSVCGNEICEANETPISCPVDCSLPAAGCNHDGVCNDNEDCVTCADDCAQGTTGGKRPKSYCCGGTTCDAGLCGTGCGSNPPACGNGVLEAGEECDDGNLVPGDGCSEVCLIEAPFTPVPSYQFNLGDSIGEGEAANGTIGEAHHETVWSSGYNSGDSVMSLNERFESIDAASYLENNASRDVVFNHAISGAVMADFAAQANGVISDVKSLGLPQPEDGMITMLFGNNDVCAPTLNSMTDPVQFEAQYRTGLDVLANNPETSSSFIHVSGIPAIYWLWNAKYTDFWCRAFVWPNVPCQNLLANPADDCVSPTSRLDPDKAYSGDGPNCVRRKTFHAKIRDIYNPILRDVLQEYIDNGKLLNAYYVDIFDVRFGSTHVNSGDCFHPSTAGHALLAGEEWCRSPWGTEDPACGP